MLAFARLRSSPIMTSFGRLAAVGRVGEKAADALARLVTRQDIGMASVRRSPLAQVVEHCAAPHRVRACGFGRRDCGCRRSARSGRNSIVGDLAVALVLGKSLDLLVAVQERAVVAHHDGAGAAAGLRIERGVDADERPVDQRREAARRRCRVRHAGARTAPPRRRANAASDRSGRGTSPCADAPSQNASISCVTSISSISAS